jgi:hypothetical protein
MRFAAFGGSGYEKPQSGLRPLCGFSPPHFFGCWNASRSFIATAKTSHTAGTLGEMPIKYTQVYKKVYKGGDYFLLHKE